MTLPFDLIRSEYSHRIDQLEKDVLLLCRNFELNDADIADPVDEPELFECEETDQHLRWQFDMREFSIDNISLEVRDNRCVKLRAHRKLNNQSSEVIKRFVLPDRTELKLTAIMRRNGMLIIEAPLKQSPS